MNINHELALAKTLVDLQEMILIEGERNGLDVKTLGKYFNLQYDWTKDLELITLDIKNGAFFYILASNPNKHIVIKEALDNIEITCKNMKDGKEGKQ